MKILPLMTFACAVALPLSAAAEVHLDKVVLPDGFKIEIYAEDVENARQMARGDQGVLFVGSRRAGKLHAVVDDDGDQKADRVILLAEELNMPSGLEFRDGSLYVGVVNEIRRYDDIENRLDDPPQPVIITDQLPTEKHHGWKYLRFGPDGFLYVPVGAPCNICDTEEYADIRQMDVSDGSWTIFADGVRNSVGITFHPDSGEMWFTDNGRDMMGDDIPDCELNHAPEAGMHFGYPYCHQGDVADPEFGDQRSCDEFVAPAMNLGPHVAPLGLAFYAGDAFPEDYQGDLFIAEHGSWNRTNKIGYRVKRVMFENGEAVGQEVFAEGWLQGEENWGRPNDVLMMPDGAMLVSDDQAGVIYRITYEGP